MTHIPRLLISERDPEMQTALTHLLGSEIGRCECVYAAPGSSEFQRLVLTDTAGFDAFFLNGELRQGELSSVDKVRILKQSEKYLHKPILIYSKGMSVFEKKILDEMRVSGVFAGSNAADKKDLAKKFAGYLRKEATLDAKERYQRVIEIDVLSGRFQDAMETIEHRPKELQALPSMLIPKALCEAGLGNTYEAQGILEKLIKLDQGTLNVRLILADLLIKAGSPGHEGVVRDLLEFCHSKVSMDCLCASMLSDLYLVLDKDLLEDKFERARSVLLTVSNHEDEGVNFRLGRIDLEDGDFDGAKTNFAKVSEKLDSRASILNAVGMRFAKVGDIRGGKIAYENALRFLQSAEKKHAILSNMGLMFSRNNQPIEAMRAFATALKASNDSEKIHGVLKQIYDDVVRTKTKVPPDIERSVKEAFLGYINLKK